MNRKEFFKKTIIAGMGIFALPQLITAKENETSAVEIFDKIGFNHIPNMKTKI